MSLCVGRRLTLVLAYIAAALGSDIFIITNNPELCRRPDCVLYQYALTADPGILSTIAVEKDGLPVAGWVDSGELIRASDGVSFGCYRSIRSLKGQPVGSKYGVYRWSATVGGDQVKINSFVKPETAQLDTRGLYTITVYPASDDPTILSEPLKFGVKYRTGCEKIKWNKGRRRGVHTGRTLTLTKVEGAAGVYEIYRGTRRSLGWSVHIEVLVSGCPEGKYGPPTCSSNCPSPTCANGGVCTSEGLCRCSPYFRGDTCQFPDAWVNRPGTNDYYYVQGDSLAWEDGRTACQAIGGDLASITSASENQFIATMLEDVGQLALGATRVNIGLGEFDPSTASGTWVSGEALDYTNWGSGAPSAAATWTTVTMLVSEDDLGEWSNFPYFFASLSVCERNNVDDPLVIGNGVHITCGQLPGGNNECKGYHFCYDGLYGCTCAGGWHGNACDQECRVGFYGPDCKLRCVEDAGCSEKRCNRFTGMC